MESDQLLQKSCITLPFMSCRRCYGHGGMVGMVEYVGLWYTWYGMAWIGMVWHGLVWHGMDWNGMVWKGMVWYDMDKSLSPSVDWFVIKSIILTGRVSQTYGSMPARGVYYRAK